MSTNPYTVPGPNSSPEERFRFDGWERLKTFGITERIGAQVMCEIIDELNVVQQDAAEKIVDEAERSALDIVEDFKVKVGEHIDKLVENLKLVDTAAREIEDVLA